MDNQNVIKNVKVDKKKSSFPIVPVIALAMAIVCGLGYVFIEFVWPVIITPIAFIVGTILGVSVMVPVIGWIIYGIGMIVLLIVSFIETWVNFLVIAGIIASFAIGIVDLCYGKGKIMSIITVAISGLVLAAIFLSSLVSLIMSVLFILLISVLAVIFGVIMLLPMLAL